jgi:SAM-dependent methyltransferase
MSAARHLFAPIERAVAAARRLHGRIRRREHGATGAVPDAAACNICGFVATEGHPRLCPGCGTNERQRSFKQLFSQKLDREVFGRGQLANALLLSPGTVERSLLFPKFQHHVVSSLHQTYYKVGDFVRADVRDLAPFASGSFDYIQACNVLDYVPEMQRAIEAVHRVIRANGVFVLLIPEYNLAKGDEPIAVSLRASVTGNYWPDQTSVPRVRVGRQTLTVMLRQSGFEPEEIRLTEPLSRLHCTWWICRRQ